MSRALRVLHVYKNYSPTFGGIESLIRTVCEGLRARDVDARALVVNTRRRTDYDEVDGVPVYRMARLANLASTPISISFFRAFAAAECDLIHLHMPYPPGDLAYALAPKGRPLVVSYHSDVVRQRRLLKLYRPLLERTLDRAAIICPTSPDYIASSPFLRPHAAKCRVVPSAPDPHRISQPPDQAQVAAWRARFKPPIVLFVGMLRYYKGLTYLIEAVRDLDVSLVIAGDGPTRRPLELQVEAAGLGDRVHLLGAIPDASLSSLYAACDVFALPSIERAEALGLSMIEAMSAGKPVICTRLGTGTTFVNQDGETGLVVPPRDAPALAAAIERLASNPALARRLGGQAQQRAATQFKPSRMLDRFQATYAEALGQPAARAASQASSEGPA